MGVGLLLAGIIVAVGQTFFGWPSQVPVRWFDLNAERSAPAWYSSMILAACSFLAASCAEIDKRASPYWWATSAVLLFMSADEAISIHEHLFDLFFPNVELGGALTFEWVVIGFPLAAIVGGLLLPLLWKVPRRTAIGIFASGTVYLTGALIVEMVGAWLVSIQHPLYGLQPILEEGLEIGGLLLLFWTLLAHLAEPRPLTGS